MPVHEIYERTTTKVVTFIASDEIASATLAYADPFDIEPSCIHPAGHHFIADCSEVVCIHCARIAWQ